MIEKINIENLTDELPSSYADTLGIYYSKNVSSNHKKDKGQFFTPIPIANLMASYCSVTKKEINILDPGCGTAILTCALVENLVNNNKEIEIIDLVAYETDAELIGYSKKTLDYLKKW